MDNSIHPRFSIISLVIILWLGSTTWATAQTLAKKDSTATKTTNQPSSGNRTATDTGGNSVGNFINSINNAGKTLSSTAKSTEVSLEKTSQVLTKFSSAIEGYAPDSLKRKQDSLSNKKL